MKNQKPLIAAAVVLLLSFLLASQVHAQGQCGTPIMPHKLEIRAYPAPNEEGVYVFVPVCDGEPCKEGFYLYQWRFGNQDYSVQPMPRRWFATDDLRTVQVALFGIKENGDPDSRYGGCPPAVLRAGGCISVIKPHCTRPMMVAELTRSYTASTQPRHEEFGKLMESQRHANYRMAIATLGGNPVPMQTSVYPLVMQNRTDVTVDVRTELKAKLAESEVILRVRKGGQSTPIHNKSDKIEVKTQIPPHTTTVMLVEATLPDAQGLDGLGEELKLEAESKFTPVNGVGHTVKRKAEKKDVVRRAIDPSYLKMRTRRNLFWGSKVKYDLVITNDGEANPELITVQHQLSEAWNLDNIKYRVARIDHQRLKRCKSDVPEEGEYYVHNRRHADSTNTLVINPTKAFPLQPGSELVISFSMRLKKDRPDDWKNSPPKGTKLKVTEDHVPHTIYTMFNNEGVWYTAEPDQQTIVKGKSLKFWRDMGRSTIVVAVSAAVYGVMTYFNIP